MPRNTRADAGTPAALLTCADVRAREWDFVEGVLPIPERVAVQTHLDGCATCRQEITLCRSAEGALVSASAQIPSAGDLRTGFYARLADQQRPSRRYGRPVALSALAVGILALALLRPSLHTPVVPPAHPGNTSNALAFDPSARATPPAAPPQLTEETPHRFRTVLGLSEEQANRLLVSVDTSILNPPRHRKALRRSTAHRVVVVLIPRSHPSLEAALEKVPEPPRYTYAVADQTQFDRRTLAKERASLPALKATFAAAGPQGPAGEQRAQYGMVVTAALPSDDGVSLGVTDQVRGFSNTTHVASDVELHDGGSTIHVQADGN